MGRGGGLKTANVLIKKGLVKDQFIWPKAENTQDTDLILETEKDGSQNVCSMSLQSN